jgi:hypothetical protein
MFAKESESQKKIMLGVYLDEETITAFRGKCREAKVTQGEAITCFVKAWVAGEYCLMQDTTAYELRMRFREYCVEKQLKPEEIVDVLLNYTISGALSFQEDGIEKMEYNPVTINIESRSMAVGTFLDKSQR